MPLVTKLSIKPINTKDKERRFQKCNTKGYRLQAQIHKLVIYISKPTDNP